MKRKILSLLIIFSMALTLILPTMTQATSHTGTNQFFYFDNYSVYESSPTTVNTPKIDITGSFSGVTADSIQYKVEQYVGSTVGQVSTYTKSGLSVSGLSFQAIGVTLFEGKNKITFSGNQGGIERTQSIWVIYDNAPILYDLEVVAPSGNLPINDSDVTIVTNQKISIRGKAPNADSVTISTGGVSKKSTPFDSQGTFFIQDIDLLPGDNLITFVIQNNKQSLTTTRKLVFYEQKVTFFDLKIEADSVTKELKDSPLVEVSNIQVDVTFSGKMLLPNPKLNDSTAIIQDSISDAVIIKLNGSSSITATANKIAGTDSDPYITYDFSQINSGMNDGSYNVTFSASNPIKNGIDESRLFLFELRNSNTIAVTDVKQVLGSITQETQAELDGKPVISLGTSTNLFELPFWLKISFNKPADVTKLKITSIQSGLTDIITTTITPAVIIPNTGNASTVYVKIDSIPKGRQQLKFKVDQGSGVYTPEYERSITYIPSQHVRFNNIYDGQIFDTDNLTKITGRLLNVVGNDRTEYSKIYLNNTLIPLLKFDVGGDPQEFEAILKDSTYNFSLVYGENTIRFEWNKPGEPKYVNEIKVYLHSKNLPNVDNVYPVPLGADSDTDALFKQNEDQYVTTEKYMDILGTFSNTTKLEITTGEDVVVTWEVYSDPYVDRYGTSRNGGGSKNGILEVVETAQDQYKFRLKNQALPNTGPITYRFKVSNNDGASTSGFLKVVRELISYEILSPTPNGKVINKNYVTVRIRAEGADKVLVNKLEATKDNSSGNDEFYIDVTGLKPGKENKIKFTIVRGTEQENGEISVFYAETSVPGAQVKEQMKKSHKVFDGLLQLQFPKDTFLKQKLEPDSAKIPEIYPSQKILFAIADRFDGVVDREQNVNASDIDFGSLLLSPPRRFAYASDLFWIDGGMAPDPSPGSGQKNAGLLDGQLPYSPRSSDIDNFFDRSEARKLVPTARGELTLKYDPNIRSVAGTLITVFHYNQEENRWENIGGVVDEKKNQVTVPFDEFGYYAVMKLKYSFYDVTQHPKYRNQIEAVYVKGVMNASEEDDFGAYDYMTRGEFASMLVKALQIPLNYDYNNTYFDDVPTFYIPNSLWQFKYIETAAREGIIRGIRPRAFEPNGFLTKEQAAIMIARAMDLKLPINDNKLAATLDKTFNDTGLMDRYAKPAIFAVYKAKIMDGQQMQTTSDKKLRFGPQDYLTRDEAADIAARVMQTMKLLPKF
ncbi:S-layer homology domain-containing protein [Microaerobacter geothermalis]|uniref:S-layer homology domain-containing protein n=1 Tax=Microaerobacter geothermalis TaxID=674972 RepID=UPI001F343482|nr:S-layer homology domain-containing protein [Microaerobacter geothermalis]MCF6093289.1 S-layer homology domain-containing protein [Microaerobacter geothermalis]